MAFVNAGLITGPSLRVSSPSKCTRAPMMSAGMTRRDALRAVGLAFGLTVVADAARAFDLKELKQDVEAIKYDDEVQEVGPDPKEELLLREKKEKKADPVIAAEENREKKEEEKYEAVVAKEQKEAAKLKEDFESRFKK